MATGSVQAPSSRTMDHSHGNSTGTTPTRGTLAAAGGRERAVHGPGAYPRGVSALWQYRAHERRTRLPAGAQRADRAEDEFSEFTSTDLPYYSDWRGSFEKLPWATDDESLRAANADVAIVGAPLDEGASSRPGARFGPRAIRMAPTAWSSDYAWSIQLDVEPYST